MRPLARASSTPSLALLAVALTTFAVTLPASAEVMTYHPGGSGAMALEMSRRPVVVDGPCLSACAWSFSINKRACFTDRASFWFHEFHDPGTGAEMRAATDYWLDLAPMWVRPGMRLTAKEMAQHEPNKRCLNVSRD